MVEFKIKSDEEAIEELVQQGDKWRKTIEKAIDEYFQSLEEWRMILERILEEGGIRVEIGKQEG